MGNDDKIEAVESEKSIHNEVMMFLGGELERIHQNSVSQSYNIEEEYAKTRKNHSVFSVVLLAVAILVVLGIAIIMTSVISTRNQEIAVSLQEFEDLNLKNLLNSVSTAQSNYDNALKVVSRKKADYENSLRMAADTRDNEIFVLDSLNLESEAEYKSRLKIINDTYESRVQILKDDYVVQLEEAEEDAEMFRLALAKFDSSAIENARQGGSLDSEAQLHKLEMRSLEERYEKRISELEQTIQKQREKNQEEMREAVNQVVAKYQAEIDRLDPKLRDKDKKGFVIIDKENLEENRTADFNGTSVLEEKSISDENFVNAVSDYQEIYNQYKYLDNQIASIPQKYSIPEYVSAARNLVNSMGDSYLEATVSHYEEKTALNQKIEDGKKELARQQEGYEAVMINMLAGLKANAAVLAAAGYDDIKIYVVPQARYLVSDEGVPAEFKADKITVKGNIIRDSDDVNTGAPRFRFVVAEDKDGNLPEIDFSVITPGQTVKLLSK